MNAHSQKNSYANSQFGEKNLDKKEKSYIQISL